jgi:hypothetical protein
MMKYISVVNFAESGRVLNPRPPVEIKGQFLGRRFYSLEEPETHAFLRHLEVVLGDVS